MLGNCMNKGAIITRNVSSEFASDTGSQDNGTSIKRSRTLSKDFQLMLDAALSTAKKRQFVIKEGEKQFAGEMFRFYAAILEWEKEAHGKNNWKRAKLIAFKLISTFVEPGALYENGCLSSHTRKLLIERKVQDAHFFDMAKYEVANDICMNPVLRGIVERYALEDASQL